MAIYGKQFACGEFEVTEDSGEATDTIFQVAANKKVLLKSILWYISAVAGTAAEITGHGLVITDSSDNELGKVSWKSGTPAAATSDTGFVWVEKNIEMADQQKLKLWINTSVGANKTLTVKVVAGGAEEDV